MIDISVQTGLAVYDRFVVLGRKIAELPEILMPQYQAAAKDLYEICRLLLDANESLARWLLEFTYFDFRNADARTTFNDLAKRYRAMKVGEEYRQLKFRCGDIQSIYERNIASKLGRLFSNQSMRDQAGQVFQDLSSADQSMVVFVYETVMVKLDRIVADLEQSVDAGLLDDAEQTRLHAKAQTRELVQALEKFGGELSELVLQFAKAAKVPVTLERST